MSDLVSIIVPIYNVEKYIRKSGCHIGVQTNFGEVNYFGKNGLPMAPFRTSRRDEETEPETVQDKGTEIRQVMEL